MHTPASGNKNMLANHGGFKLTMLLLLLFSIIAQNVQSQHPGKIHDMCKQHARRYNLYTVSRQRVAVHTMELFFTILSR